METINSQDKAECKLVNNSFTLDSVLHVAAILQPFWPQISVRGHIDDFGGRAGREKEIRARRRKSPVATGVDGADARRGEHTRDKKRDRRVQSADGKRRMTNSIRPSAHSRQNSISVM